MTRMLRLAALALVLAGPATAQSGQDGAQPSAAAPPSYDLLFKTGTLDALGDDATLSYNRRVSNRFVERAAARDSGRIALVVDRDETPPQATLRFRRGEAERSLGSFPASVGNPVIMYFYETVARDMAESAGGSPFYIRNRMKEALVRPAEIEEGTATFDGQSVPTQTVTLRPFAEDPNRERMSAFGDLAIRVTMSEAVPGWYLSLQATAPEGDAPAYDSRLMLEGATEGGQ